MMMYRSLFVINTVEPFIQWTLVHCNSATQHGGGRIMLWCSFKCNGTGKLEYINDTMKSGDYGKICENHQEVDVPLIRSTLKILISNILSFQHWKNIVCSLVTCMCVSGFSFFW